MPNFATHINMFMDWYKKKIGLPPGTVISEYKHVRARAAIHCLVACAASLGQT